MPMVCIKQGTYIRTRIHTAWAPVLLFGLKAIPEPQIAEQQDCSPAFLFVICGNSIKDVQRVIFEILDYRKKEIVG